MNKLMLVLSLLKYSITHPYGGLQLIQSRYQVYRDSKNKNQLHNYSDIKIDVNDVLRIFSTSYPISELKENLKPLEIHLSNFFTNLEKEKYPSKSKPYPSVYTLDNSSGFLLYALCKIIKPDKVVETGVAYGLGTTYILQALHENNKGMLYSIDYEFRPWESKKMIGSAIPDYLRERWKLIYGPSSQKLNKLLDSIGEIDIFFHDSLHTYDNMMFEFKTAWGFIKKNGLLLSDDITSNNAFYKFHFNENLEPIIFSQKDKTNSFLGIIKKL